MDSWTIFFNKIHFTLFRTAEIQKRYIELIIKYAKSIKKPEIKLLEIAAGSGTTSILLADFLRPDGAKIYISDINKELIEKIEKIHWSIPNISTVICDAADIKVELGFYDIIYHQGFLEHFSDDEIVLYLIEGARAGRFVIFDVPNSLRTDKKQEFGNERFLSPKKWESLVREAGLVVVERGGRRFTNWWKKYVPVVIRDTNWFHKVWGESTLIVCKRP